jgi:hypothetical protein
MNIQQRVIVALELLGGPKFATQTRASAKAMVALGGATKLAGEEAILASKRTWLHNQAMFTMRRYAFYGTLAITGLAFAVAKWGFTYLSALQKARVALTPVIRNQALLNHYLNELFQISKFSPFVITDIATAFRTMYAQMSHVGITARTVLQTIKQITNYLSYTGKTTPGDLAKVSNALAKMANYGRLTGITVRSLGSVGVPIATILAQKFGIARDQLAHIASFNLAPNTVLKAIIDYAKHDPGIRNAALTQSLKTFAGLLQVTRDTISQISGHLLGGSFGGGQGWLAQLVKPGGSLDKISRIQSGSGTILGISKALTGGTALGHGFLLLLSTVQKLATVFVKVLLPGILLGMSALVVLYPVLKILNIILDQMVKHATFFKVVIGALVGRFILYKLAIYGIVGATRAWTFANVLWTLATYKQTSAMKYWGVEMLWYQRVIVSIRNTIIGLDLATLGWIGLIIAIIGAVVILYYKWKPFHDLVNKTFNELKSGSVGVRIALTLAFGPLGIALQEMILIIKYWDRIKKLGSHPKKTVQKGLGFFHNLTNLATPLAFAAGGTTPYSGSFMVGERGPEMVNLPAGSQIIPHNQLSSSVSLSSAVGGAGNDRPIVVQVMLDRKVLAQGVARAKSDIAARK